MLLFSLGEVVVELVALAGENGTAGFLVGGVSKTSGCLRESVMM
jgi:hypothetical protein